MADNNKPPEDDEAARKAFEEARREFDDEEELESESESKTDGRGGNGPDPPRKPTLRVIPGGKPATPKAWQVVTWLPTGENVVLEFMSEHGAEFRQAEGRAMTWDKRWDDDGHCSRLGRKVAEFCREICATKKKAIRDKLESARFINGVTGRVAQEVSIPIGTLDQARVINTPAATLERNAAGVWTPREHRRDDLCTKITRVAPVAGELTMWLGFLNLVMEGDHEMIDYLQRVAGYILSPSTSEQVFFFFYGTGGNGKGTFLRALAHVLGDYAATASLDLFLATKYEQHPEELAGLRAVRLVMATETEKGRAWNESKIKALTGGDKVRARYMRQDSFEYVPQFKIVVSGNNKPTIKSTDEAMARRLQLVPFETQVQPDPTFEAKMLARESEAILAWVLEGLAEYEKHGLSPPDKVVAASEEYLEEQDELQQWIGERCEIGPELWAYSIAMLQDYNKWRKAQGLFPISSKTLVADLKKKKRLGLQHDKSHGNMIFRGIGLKPIEEREDYR